MKEAGREGRSERNVHLHFGLLELLVQGDVPGGYLEIKMVEIHCHNFNQREYKLIVNTYPTRLDGRC